MFVYYVTGQSAPLLIPQPRYTREPGQRSPPQCPDDLHEAQTPD